MRQNQVSPLVVVKMLDATQTVEAIVRLGARLDGAPESDRVDQVVWITKYLRSDLLRTEVLLQLLVTTLSKDGGAFFCPIVQLPHNNKEQQVSGE